MSPAAAQQAADPPRRIRQWVTGQDGLDKLRIEEVDLPTPGEDKVLVEVRAVSLNYRDTEGMSCRNTQLALNPLFERPI